MKTVSIHIVTFNSAKDISDCLDAIFKQSYPILRIIVVDNASKDATRDVLSRYEEQIQVIYNDDNKGFAGAHNQAIHLSTADYYLILNPDVTLDQHYVQKLMEAAQQSSIGSLTGRLLLKSDPSIVDSTGLVLTRQRRAFDRGSGEQTYLWDESGNVFGVSGAAALYNSKMVKDISYKNQFFDESFFAYKEDVDVAWRAQKLGWLAYYEADAIAYHERGWKKGTRFKQPLFIRQRSYINRYKMIYKNDSLSRMIKDGLHILPFEIASFAYALLRDPKLLLAWKEFINELPQLREKKEHIQGKSR